ncbi:aldo/keto reductase [Chryseolinea soli]|uniref:Aldo/keto reductase n=1 Tax=Chryseolinea soli TaxID=2321403 RepID=A0A385SYL3_9BACT|nr:aldo/keto reductase [Chryseolinea soli]AYB34840.1 aldo/keto reductase [Chryseolinea soli]
MTIPDNNTYKIGNDLAVNRIGFGAMRITGEGVWGQPKNRDEAIRVLQALPGLGVNFIDTADSYGPYVSEELIAQALHPYPADMVIATKGGLERSGPNAWHINGHPDHLREALEGSLKRLKLDRIDLYQLHRIDPKVPFESTMSFLQKAQQQGLIKHIGLSEVNLATLKKAQQFVSIVSLQNRYSIVARNWEPELEYCREHHIAFIPWNPINAGDITYAAKLTKIANKHKATGQQVALSWLYHHSPNILLIPGTSKASHLAENVKAAEVKLTAEEMAELSTIE